MLNSMLVPIEDQEEYKSSLGITSWVDSGILHRVTDARIPVY